MNDRPKIDVASYKQTHDTEQGRIRAGDKVTRRYGPSGAIVRTVERIYRHGERGHHYLVFKTEHHDGGLTPEPVLAAHWQKFVDGGES